MSEKTVLVTLVVVGFVITLGLSIVSGAASFNGLFFGVGAPLMAIAAFVAAYVCPPRTWSYGCAVTGGAWVARCGLAGGTITGLSLTSALSMLLPPAILYAVAIAVVCGGAAKLGQFLEQRSAS